jgi:acyl CoA:acetate/3-ketoacid CoA transferase
MTNGSKQREQGLAPPAVVTRPGLTFEVDPRFDNCVCCHSSSRALSVFHLLFRRHILLLSLR